jgi:inorganic pyrophosphatase/exopolyphosphatase
MKDKYVVVGGRAYADIDVLACISAYTELLNLKGLSSHGIITGPWNQTIPESIKKWPINIKNTHWLENTPCKYVLVDISDPNHMEHFVTLDNVAEVYDHHYGHEQFWKEKLPHSTYIERVGACATLIWEKCKENALHSSISTLNANLLYTAIFANTLNFKSQVTSDRDLLAAEELLKLISLPLDWKSLYYAEVAEGFNKNLAELIQKDTKTVDVQGLQIHFGQVEIWNAASIIDRFECKFQPNPKQPWLVNIASIEENCSFFYSNSAPLKEKITEITRAKDFNPYIQLADRLWLRKEILRELSKYTS